jgi:hypothetical protein
MSKNTNWCRLALLAVTAVAGLTWTTPGRADDAPTTAPSTMPATGMTTDDPRFGAWKKFKVGSSATIAGNITMQGVEEHVEQTQTLTDVKADSVTVEDKITMTAMGNSQAMPPQSETIKAKTDKMGLKLTGEKDVEAAGKTYKCKVYEMAAKPDQLGGAKGTFYTNDDVPGGTVEMDITDKTGAVKTFKLTGCDVK